MMKAIYFKSTFDKSGGYPVIYGTFENPEFLGIILLKIIYFKYKNILKYIYYQL